jgi:putative ABC transport system permease protein
VKHDAARRLYRRCLRLAPRRLRVRHGDEMEALFLEALDRVPPTGRVARWAVWARAILDLLLASLREPFRRSAVAPRPSRRSLMITADLRSAWRGFRRQRFSTSLIVAMLALGIAANFIVFSLANALIFRPFPFPNAERLVYVNETAPKWNLDVVSVNFPDFWQWHEHTTTFEALAYAEGLSVNLSDDTGAQRVLGGMFTREYPAVLGLNFILGRTFTAEEDRPKGPDVVILSERLWRERFGARSDVLGQAIRLNGTKHEIVGVLPRRAEFPEEAALWVPVQGDPTATSQSYSGSVIGRLKPGISVSQAHEDLQRAQVPIWEARDKERIVSPFAKPLRTQVVSRDSETVAAALGGAVALLLLVICANVASVLLARAIARRREMGIRIAVGAGRGRLVRQLFVENVLLSTVAGVVGLVIGRWGLTALIAALDQQIPQWAEFTMDLRTAAFAVGLTLATALLFGWAPALHALRGNVRSAIHDSVAGTTASPRGRRTLAILVAIEFALAAILLVAGGLLVRAFDRIHHVDPGFRTDHVLTFAVSLPAASYEDPAKRLAFWDRLLTEIRSAPGATHAGLISCPPLGCHNGMFYKAEGQPPRKPGDTNPVVLTRVASEDYFEAMGVKLAHGRAFDVHDRQPNAPLVVIVNETFARTFWPGVEDPVGRKIGFNDDSPPNIPVVGVTKDIKHYGLERQMIPGVYLPMSWPRTRALSVVVHTANDPEAFTPIARTIVTRLDPELPIFQVGTMETALARSLRSRAVYSTMLGVFAVLALVLAVAGTYGVTAYLVGQRTREIGIRMAIGAERTDILRAVLRASAPGIVAGILVGVAVASLLAGQLGSLLFGVSPRDVGILTGSAFVLVVAGLVANWFPARRAASANPITALRN